MTPAAVARTDAALPSLREDLQMLAQHETGREAGGTVFDPVAQQYYKISVQTAQLLSIWPQAATRSQLIALAQERFGLVLRSIDIDALVLFLERNGLSHATGNAAWKQLAAQQRSRQRGWLSWLIHNYLFVRIPLLHPDRGLKRIAPWFSPFYSRGFLVLMVLVAVCGLHLVSRQWDTFLATFLQLYSLEGLLLYAFAVVLVKSLHELGHAITAARYGCRVPTMGICFMVMMPMLYTDVTDAWKLRSRRQRLAIDAAGLIVETGLAAVATLAWVVLPDGPWRSLAFVIATTSWLMSLGLNLNPFMRFDGYYILSDFTGVENLQPRSFAVGRWRLRRWLLGIDRPPPEPLPARRLAWLTAYAWAVWLYRLIIFTGIALLVYHLAFKVLGLILFAIEILYFIALPIWRELREWTAMRSEILRSPRALITASIVAGAIVAALVPWSTRVIIPAVAEAREAAQLFPVRAARIKSVTAVLGAKVAAGDAIAELESPDLAQDIARTARRIDLIRLRLARRGSDAQDRTESIILENTLNSLLTKRDGLLAETRELTVRAPIAGIVAELDPYLHPGRWLQRSDPIATIRAERGAIARGYVGESDVERIVKSAPAVFVPEDIARVSAPVQLSDIAAVGSQHLDLADLASAYGGPVPTRIAAGGRSRQALVPTSGQFLVTASVDADGEWTRSERGSIHAEGRPESFAARVWRQIFKVLVRESGA